MQKKKILIVSHAMEIGGAERALLGLLENIDTNTYDVDLFLLRQEGELMKFIPDNINLLPEIPQYTVLARPMIQTIKEGHILLTAARLYGRKKAEQYVKKEKLKENDVAIEYSHKYTKKFMPLIQKDIEYDLAISFLTPHYFVTEKVKAKRKIAWIHTDYSVVKIDQKSQLQMWSAYDYIASISENVTESFLRVFPELKEKVVLIENILPKTLIEKQANESMDGDMKPGKSVCLLSIGRFSYPKNFDNVPDICRRIRNQGIDAKWYLIGYGGDEALIRKKIKETEMQNHVIILGKKENPYPYIKACDIYVQPSRYEGKCVAVCEAQMLGKPVVITNYSTAESQLENGIDGIIVPMDNKKFASSVVEFILDCKRKMQMRKNCMKRDYSNSVEINKLYTLC